MKRKHTPLYDVKQLIQVNTIKAANALLAGGWVLVRSYTNRGWLYIVMGRINDTTNGGTS